MLGEPVEKFNFDKVAPVTIPVTSDEKEKQMTLNNNVLFNKKGNPNMEYWSVPKDVTLRSSNTDKTKSAKVVDIKKYKFKNILIVDEDGEVRDFSPEEFIQSVTTRQVRIRKAIEAREDGTSPDIGVLAFDGALDAFAREGRFVEVSALNKKSFWKNPLKDETFNLANSNSIIFIKPSTNVVSNQEVNTSDLIQAGEDNSLTDEEENLNRDNSDSSVYSHIAVEAMMINKNFINAPVEIQNREVAELINDHPEKEEEITKLYDNFKENITPINNEIEIPKTTELNTSSDSLLNRAPEKQDVTSSAQRKEKANEMFNKITTVPSLLRERGKNQERKRATGFLSGEKVSFSSTSYTSWKRENNIVDNYSTSRKEKEKNVKNYLEFLNQ